jgi:hypothetical protein
MPMLLSKRLYVRSFKRSHTNSPRFTGNDCLDLTGEEPSHDSLTMMNSTVISLAENSQELRECLEGFMISPELIARVEGNIYVVDSEKLSGLR